jgi:hypothetical protein
MKRENKRGVFFSTDALIALIIILLSILVVYPITKPIRQASVLQEDVLVVLSSLRVNEIDDDYVQNDLIGGGWINDPNKSLLEQIGEFYVTNKTLARGLSEAVLNYVNTSDNIGIWYGNTLLASKNSTPIETARNIDIGRRTIGGIKGLNETESVTGFSARAFLTSALQRNYYYFGGYVGDGNISVLVDINYTGMIKEIYLEIATNTNFSLCINDELCSGHFAPPVSEFEPMEFDLSAYNGSFNPGENIVKFKPVSLGDSLYIAGGFMKITYNNSQKYELHDRYNFPGIEGIINIYDGFYVPGNLNGMSINITLDSNETTYLIIGNKTIFNQSTTGVETIEKTSAEILAILGNYDDYEEKTIPLRLGIENISYVPLHNAYIMSVADLSGGVSSAKADCDENGVAGENSDEKGVNAVKCANIQLVDLLLDVAIVEIGLAGTDTDVDEDDYHELSRDQTSLNATIDGWDQENNLDLCEGIQNATGTLNDAASGEDFKSIVLLGTKEPNSCLGGPASTATADTLALACDTWTNHNIRIDTVGIIDGPGDQNLDTMLRDIADCANGTYYNQSADDDLVDLYKALGGDLLGIIFYMQTAGSVGGFTSYLSPNSYIEFDYDKAAPSYGLITTIEQKFQDNYYGNFSIPPSTELIEVLAISYSGPRWTDYAEINYTSVYNLSAYGGIYTRLGDPYAFHIPNSLVQEENTVKITTGVSPLNSTSGSEHNKILYTVKQNVSSFSEVVAFARGCLWHIEFDDGSIEDINIPSGYNEIPTQHCYYNSSNQPEQDCDGRECNDGDDPEADAIQLAVFDLLELLDVNGNQKIDVKFTEQDLQIGSSEIVGIPYTYSTEAQVRRWD